MTPGNKLSEKNWKYDVYISFALEDTRRSFVSYLYEALASKGINVFLGHKLKGFKLLDPSALFEVIESSKISIVVFSKNFAASGWCLDEVVKIVECRKRRGQIVVPVFYDVDPYDVLELKGGFGAVLEKFGDVKDDVEKWRYAYALKEVAVLSGWVPKIYEDEATLIDEIVKDVESKIEELSVDDKFVGGMDRNQESCDEDDSIIFGTESQLSTTETESLLSSTITEISYPRNEDCDSETSSDMESYTTEEDPLLSDFVGMDSPVRDVTAMLSIEKSNVRVIGIWGMGGIGKTTIAKIVYDKLSHQYESSCFLENVSVEFERLGANALRQQVLSSLLPERITSMDSSARMMKERLRNRKVLIVLDNVNDLDQLKMLPERNGMGYQSRIIITSRDRHLLSAYGVDGIYEVKALNRSQALKLFSRNAFKRDQPKREYLEMTKKFVHYAKGLPRALIDLGSFLDGRSILEWESSLERLKRVPDQSIFNVLEISFKSLDDLEKQVFLDVACFFVGMDKNTVTEILEGCGFYPSVSLLTLIDKSMISIENDTICMHNLLQQMGREIVHQEEPQNPGKRSRLWNHEDVYDVLVEKKGTKRVEGISLDMSEIREMSLDSSVFTKMPRLRLLKFYPSSSTTRTGNIELPDGIDFLSSNLRYLHWHAYPLKSLPSNFYPEMLVVLHLPYSNVEQLWTGRKSHHLPYLKSLDLSYSKLNKFPDLSGASNLKVLNLQGCRNLIEITSISYLTKLEDLYLKNCSRLRSIGNIDELHCLKRLDLTGCSNLNQLRLPSTSTKYLSLSRTPVKQLPSSVARLSKLEELDLSYTFIHELPSPIASLSSLVSLYISDCSKLLRLPELPPSLKHVKLSNVSNPLQMVPFVFVYWNYSLSKSLLFYAEYLVELNLAYCNAKEPWTGKQLLVNLRSFKLKDSKLIRVPNLSEARKLERLDVQGCANMNEISSIKNLTKLEYLHLDHCKNLEKLPSMVGLVSLIEVKVSACSSLKVLPELPDSIRYLYLIGIPIKELPSSIGHLTNLVKLDLTNCKKLARLPSSIFELKALQFLNISGCSILLSLL